jgi:hypothetical protein
VLSLPAPRGELSGALISALTGGAPLSGFPAPDVADPLADDDLHLALYLCYELHYRGLPGVDARWEWEPSLLAASHMLEAVFVHALRATVAVEPSDAPPGAMDLALRAITDADDGPSLSRHLEHRGTLEELREFVVHRSAYQLKEADPHSFVIPRLYGPPKAALLEVQFDEYGSGRADRIHATLFADAMDELGLDARYGAYVGVVPGVTLATVNVMSLFGLHRRWRGAVVGHLAAFEMTSSIPNRRYAAAVRRHGFGERATAFFDEHVTADAVHEQVAAVDLAGGLVRQEPELAGDVLWGARCLLDVEARWARHVLAAWAQGRTSLLAPLEAATV